MMAACCVLLLPLGVTGLRPPTLRPVVLRSALKATATIAATAGVDAPEIDLAPAPASTIAAAGATPPQNEPKPTTRFTLGLAFLFGVSDVICVAPCYTDVRCFGSMMTGNIISLASALGALQWADAGFFAAVIANYMGGVVMFRRIDATRRRRSSLRFSAGIVFGLFCACDLLAARAGTRWPMLPLALGFGALNAISSEATGAITSMVTGHLQKLSVFVADALAGERQRSPPGARQSLVVLLTFAAGVGVAVGSAARLPITLARSPQVACLGLGFAALLWAMGQAEAPGSVDEIGDACVTDDEYFTTCL